MSSKVNLEDCEFAASIKFLCPKCEEDNYLPAEFYKFIKNDPGGYIIHKCWDCGEELRIEREK